MTDATISEAIETLLVAGNPRQMRRAQSALTTGYYLRAARHLKSCSGNIIIGTGFPVAGTFETDGPVGAIALYRSLESLGAQPILACGEPLYQALASDFRVLPLTATDLAGAKREARDRLGTLCPDAVVSIERPGLAADGNYYNMRGEDISEHCAIFDPYLTSAICPTIAIGDGGNEIGMGNIGQVIATLDIPAAVTTCDELLVADVSNWGAYGLIALLALWSGRDLLAEISVMDILQYLSRRGSVDGVTRQNALTEDGLPASEGLRIIGQLRQLTGFADTGM